MRAVLTENEVIRHILIVNMSGVKHIIGLKQKRSISLWK